MKIDAETKEKIEELPISLRYIAKYLINAVDNIINGECNEKETISVMATLEENIKGRYHDEDLMNYDKAGNALGFGATNRNGLKNLLDINGIKQVKLNNMRCGFRRSEIMALAAKLDKERKEKELKRLEKKKTLGVRFR